MHRILLFILLTTSLFAKDIIAVLALETISITPGEATILTQRLTTKLISIGRYDVVERANMDKILKEQKFQKSGCTDSECAVEIGQLLNTDFIVIGSVNKFGSTWTLDARLIDVGLGKSIVSADFTIKGEIDVLLTSGIPSIANQLCGTNEGQSQPIVKEDPPKSDYNKVYNIPIGDSFVIGNINAPVTIIEWISFQCQYCSRMRHLMDDLLKHYPNDIKIVIKHFPLSFHKQSKKASIYALAAERQGKYWALHHKIFENYEKLERDEKLPRRLAKKMGLNMKEFDRDVKDPTLEARIDEELNQMRQSGIPRLSVPKILINGKEPIGKRTLANYIAIIDAELINTK